MTVRYAILTSGGDHSGLNAVVRSAVRTGLSNHIDVYGIRRGYLGLTEGQIEPLTGRAVAGTLGRGGTWLGTARLPTWKEAKVRREAIRHLNSRGISGLVVVGGNGSLSGAHALHQDGFPVIGIPGSIDDDVNGTEVCIGVDTALNIIIEAIDRVRDCASSIQRAFVVEVMGRDCGALALMAASATGAELCLVPEEQHAYTPQQVADVITNAYMKGKPHAVIVVAEGWKPGVDTLVQYLQSHEKETGFDVRTTVLGYTQRGGAPSFKDRLYGTMMGRAAIEALMDGQSGQMVGIVGGKIALIPFEEVTGKLKPIDAELMQLYKTLDI
jgi:6-phosphofructokinase 1